MKFALVTATTPPASRTHETGHTTDSAPPVSLLVTSSSTKFLRLLLFSLSTYYSFILDVDLVEILATHLLSHSGAIYHLGFA